MPAADHDRHRQVIDHFSRVAQIGLEQERLAVRRQLLADRAFDADWLREALTGAGIEPVIPPRSNRRFPAGFDRKTYKWRHLIETLFGRLKEYRGIAMRCCKTDESFSAFIALAATVIRLR